MSREGANRRSSPTPATRPIKYALEIWVELEVSPGVYGTPKDDSYGIDFVVETLNQAYPGCTGLYLDVAGHMVAFYGKKGHSKAGLLQEQGIQASQAIATIPLGWDTPPPGGCGVSVLLRLTKLLQPVKGWKGRTGGELVGSFSTGSPPCDWVPLYQQSPNHSSLRQPRVRR